MSSAQAGLVTESSVQKLGILVGLRSDSIIPVVIGLESHAER